jgi:FtsZ-binding cell division protein ZapB
MDELLKLKQQMIEALQSENESLKHKNNILEMMLKEYSTQVKMLARKNNNQFY